MMTCTKFSCKNRRAIAIYPTLIILFALIPIIVNIRNFFKDFAFL